MTFSIGSCSDNREIGTRIIQTKNYIVRPNFVSQESFWKNFIEHFGAFALNNLFPYTSSNSASSHNIDHQECVNKLIYGLKPVSNSVNRFVESYYKGLCEKLSELKWGVFAPRSFGIYFR